MSLAFCDKCNCVFDTDAEDYEVREEVKFICEQCKDD